MSKKYYEKDKSKEPTFGTSIRKITDAFQPVITLMITNISHNFKKNATNTEDYIVNKTWSSMPNLVEKYSTAKNIVAVCEKLLKG